MSNAMVARGWLQASGLVGPSVYGARYVLPENGEKKQPAVGQTKLRKRGAFYFFFVLFVCLFFFFFLPFPRVSDSCSSLLCFIC